MLNGDNPGAQPSPLTTVNVLDVARPAIVLLCLVCASGLVGTLPYVVVGRATHGSLLGGVLAWLTWLAVALPVLYVLCRRYWRAAVLTVDGAAVTLTDRRTGQVLTQTTRDMVEISGDGSPPWRRVSLDGHTISVPTGLEGPLLAVMGDS